MEPRDLFDNNIQELTLIKPLPGFKIISMDMVMVLSGTVVYPYDHSADANKYINPNSTIYFRTTTTPICEISIVASDLSEYFREFSDDYNEYEQLKF